MRISIGIFLSNAMMVISRRFTFIALTESTFVTMDNLILKVK